MKAEVVDLGPCKKRLTVEVEVEKVKEQYDETCGELGRNVLLPGFRKGRVPRNLLVSKFGKQIDADVKAKLLDSSFKDAVKEKELEPVGEPDLDVEKVEFDAEKPLKYDCEIEVKPEFDPPDCEGLKLEKPSEEVADGEVDEAIDRIRRRFAQVHPVEGPAAAEDFVTVDVRLDIDGQEAWKDSELPLGLMESRALGLPFEVPSEKFIGLEAGKGFSTEVEVPMNFKIEEYRGKTGVAEIEVKDVKRPRLPDVDEAFAKRMGEADVDGLRLRVRGSLIEEKKNGAQAELRRQVVDHLIAGVEFELPEKLLAAAAERDELRRRYHLEQMGVRGDALSDDARQEMRNVSRQQAERDLRGFLILEKIAKIRDLEPSDEEVDGHFGAMAARRGVDPAALKNHAEEHGELEGVKAELRERKVMEFIISKANITEKPPEKKKAAKPAAKKAKKAEKPEKAEKPAKKPAKPASDKSPAGKKKSVRTKAVKDAKPAKKPAKKKSVRAKAVKDAKPAKKSAKAAPKKAAKKSAKKSDKKK
ncbi:MAG: trigger factor [Planctomycetota bacterium]|jgi:trigger factor